MKNYIVLLFMLLAISGCNEEPPISVELGRNSYWGSPQLHITSMQDVVTINGIKVNRGNCKATAQERLPYEIRFGQVLKVDALSCQNLVEASISTSEGDWDFTF